MTALDKNIKAYSNYLKPILCMKKKKYNNITVP